MKKSKRALSFLLACLLCIGAFPLSVFATEPAAEALSEEKTWTDADYDALYVSDADGDGESDIIFKWDAFDLKAEDGAVTELVNHVNNSQSVATPTGIAGDGYLLTQDTMDFSLFFRSFAKKVEYEGENVMVLQDSTWEIMMFQNNETHYEKQDAHAIRMAPLSHLNLAYVATSDLTTNFMRQTYGLLTSPTNGSNLQVATDALPTIWAQRDNQFLSNPRGAEHTYTIAFRHDYTVPEGEIQGTVIFDMLRNGEITVSSSGFKSSYLAAYDARYTGNWKAEPKTLADNAFTFGRLDFGYRAIRIYDVPLTEVQLQQNHVADLFKYYRVDLALYHEVTGDLYETMLNTLATYAIGNTSKEEIEVYIDLLLHPATTPDPYGDLYVTDADGDGESDIIFKWDAFDLKAEDGAVTELVNHVNNSQSVATPTGIAGDGYLLTQDTMDFSLFFRSFAKKVEYEGENVMVLQDSTWEIMMFQNNETHYEKQDAHAIRMAPLSHLNLAYVATSDLTTNFMRQTYGLLTSPTNGSNLQVATDALPTIWAQRDNQFLSNPRGAEHTYTIAFRHDYTVPEGEIQGTVIFDMLRNGEITVSSSGFKSSYLAAYDARYTGNWKAEPKTLADNAFTFGRLDFGYRAIRIYDVALTSEQMAQNHAIDLLKYYDIDPAPYRALDDELKAGVHKELLNFEVGQSDRKALETIIINYALTEGKLDVSDVSDYISFVGVQARTDDYAAIRVRYLVSAEGLERIQAVGGTYCFGVLYAEQDKVASADAMAIAYNPAIGEFTKKAGDFVHVPVCAKDEFFGNLSYLKKDGDIDFGVILSSFEMDAEDRSALAREYVVRAYLGISLGNIHLVLYLDLDPNGIFGSSLSIDRANEYFLCNGYAYADIPSRLADQNLVLASQTSEKHFLEANADYKALTNAIATVKGAYKGASNRIKDVGDADANIDISMDYYTALDYASTLAMARGELAVYLELGKSAYETVSSVSSTVGAKVEARKAAALQALLDQGIEEAMAEEMVARMNSSLENGVDQALDDKNSLDVAYEGLLSVEKQATAYTPELRLSKVIVPVGTLIIDGTNVSRFTIVTDAEHLAAAQMLQKFFIVRQGAYVAIYQTDDEYIGKFFDMASIKNAIYVGVTKDQITEKSTYSVYYNDSLGAICIEGDTQGSLTAGVFAFLHTHCAATGRIRLSCSELGDRLIGGSCIAMYELNIQASFPTINVSSYDVKGVLEGFRQRLAEAPEHVTVVPKLDADDAQLAVYVSNETGDDEKGNGSFEKPYKTLSRAVKALAYCGGGKIILRGGTYSVTETVSLSSVHSGTRSSPLFITNYENEEVVLTTGKAFSGSALKRATEADFLPSGALDRLNAFKADNAKNIYVLDLKTLGLTASDLSAYVSGKTSPSLYIGNDKKTVARYPNVGETNEALRIKNGWIQTMDSQDDVKTVGLVTSATSNLYYEHKEDPKTYWEFYVDKTTYLDHLLAYDESAVADQQLWTYGSVYEEWDLSSRGVTLKKEGSRYYLRSETYNHLGIKYHKDNAIYFYNMLEDLDVAGEYVLDAKNMVLYVYSEESLAGRDMTLCSSSHAVFNANGCQNVVIDGLNIERCYGIGVQMTNTDHMVVQDCIFRNLNGYAVKLSDCTQSGVSYSEFYRCNGVQTAVSTAKSSVLSPTRNFIQNNKFLNKGDTHAASVAVNFSGVADVLSHNYFYETTVSFGVNYECILEYNELERGSQYVKDNGPFYIGTSSRALHVRYNYLHDLNYSLYGIYLDDTTSSNYVYGNIIHYASDAPADGKCVNLHNGSMNVVENNICINSTTNPILNNINYYPKTINGVPTGGGGLGYRWAKIGKEFMLDKINAIDEEVRASRFPVLNAFGEVVARSIDQMNNNPSWDPEHKISPYEDDEIYTRTPLYNAYINNVFVNCKDGLKIPEIGYDTAVVQSNKSYELSRVDQIFTDYANGDFSIREDSILFRDISGFYAPDISMMGVLED